MLLPCGRGLYLTSENFSSTAIVYSIHYSEACLAQWLCRMCATVPVGERAVRLSWTNRSCNAARSQPVHWAPASKCTTPAFLRIHVPCRRIVCQPSAELGHTEAMWSAHRYNAFSVVLLAPA